MVQFTEERDVHKRKKIMDTTLHNRVYMAYRYGISNWYDDAWEFYKSYGRFRLKNWKNYRRTQWKTGSLKSVEN